LPLFKYYPLLTRVLRGRLKEKRYKKKDICGPRGAAAVI
jgi:hypothetical protein